MATLTIADLDNGKRDLETVDAVANSQADTTTTRYGQQTLTLAGALRRLGWQAPVPYVSGLTVDHATMTVEKDGVVYRPDPSLVPFTTGAWNPDQWRVVANTHDTNQVYQFSSLSEAQSASATLPEGSAVIVEGESQGHVIDGQYAADKSAASHVGEFPSYADLRSYKGLAVSADITNIGIAGRFYRRGTSSDNGGTVIRDSLGRSWERDYSGAIDARWFYTGDAGSAITKAIATGGEFAEVAVTSILPITTEVNLNGFRGSITFPGGGLQVNAPINVFKTDFSAYGVRIVDPYIFRGTAVGNVTAFDLTNFRQLGAAIVRPRLVDLDYGIYCRTGCWGLKIDHPQTLRVKAPITFVEACAAATVISPNLDEYEDAGIWVKAASAGMENVGISIIGGYIQDGTYGVIDDGMQTQLRGVYFERNSAADIAFRSASRFSIADGCNHTASVGARAYMGTGAVAARVINPFMPNGARSIGLFDFDSSCVDCKYDAEFSEYKNIPLGVTLGIIPLHATTGRKIQNVSTGVAVDIFSASAAGRYDISVCIPQSGNSAAYAAFATVVSDGTSARIVANNGTAVTLTLSGLIVQMSNASGSTQTLSASWTRI